MFHFETLYTDGMRKSFLLSLAALTMASSGQAEKIDFQFAPLTETWSLGQTEMTASTKDYVLAGVFKKAAVGEDVLEFAYIPKDRKSDIGFCITFTNLGVQGDTLVLKMKDYSVTASKSYSDLFFKDDGTISSSGTFICRVGKLYSSNFEEIVYIPKNTAFALPDRLSGYKMNIALNESLEMLPSIK